MLVRNINNGLLPLVLIATLAFVLFSNHDSSFEMMNICSGGNGHVHQMLSGTSGTIFAARRIRYFPQEERVNFLELLEEHSGPDSRILPFPVIAWESTTYGRFVSALSS